MAERYDVTIIGAGIGGLTTAALLAQAGRRPLVIERSDMVGGRGKMRPYITFHGLRHTFASHWVLHGGDIFRLQKILGHKSIDLTMRYAHLAPEAFAEDFGRLGSCAPASEAEILEFPSAANPTK